MVYRLPWSALFQAKYISSFNLIYFAYCQLKPITTLSGVNLLVWDSGKSMGWLNLVSLYPYEASLGMPETVIFPAMPLWV
jgi:hypothetical protein